MNILLAIDDSHFASLIADFVEKHTWPEESTFRVIHILSWVPREAKASQLVRETVDRDTEKGAQMVADVCRRLEKRFPGFRIEQLVLEGKPAERILEMSKGWPADVLVVGNHARKGLPLFILGSVSTALVNAAPCSVLVVKDPQPALVE